MSKCPHCDAALDVANGLPESCPTCGRVLAKVVEADTIDSPETPHAEPPSRDSTIDELPVVRKTIQGSVQSTIDIDEAGIVLPGQADPTGPSLVDSGIDSGPDGTIILDGPILPEGAASTPETPTLPDMPLPPPSDQAGAEFEPDSTSAPFDPGKTVPEQIGGTVELSEAEQALLQSADGSAGPGRVDATIDSTEMPFPVEPKAPTVQESGRTIELSSSELDESQAYSLDAPNVSQDLATHINSTWGSQDGMSIGTSLKANVTESFDPDTTLVIQPRVFREADAARGPADYDLKQLLGEGGMGMVYAARQASIDRTVAIKMLKPKTARDTNQRNKFLAEAAVTGELEHPNIVPIYELGRNAEGALFYAMKRVQGTPWDDALPKKTTAENIEILMKVCDAMAFAHSKHQVVHRDLKPENVMLGDYGEVLVMDWGLAIPVDRQRKFAGIKPQVSMGGTPAYMSPEMATGPFDKIGPRSDVYLLGAILFEIVTGTTAHTGSDVMMCLMNAARNEIQETEVEGELLDIALKAMSTQPEDRYATVEDLQQAIRNFQSHSQSIAIAVQSAEHLERAQQDRDYEAFNRASFGFQQALEMWDGNERAASGLGETQLAYAECAYEKGDYDLGLSLLKADDPNHAPLGKKLSRAKAESEARHQRLKGLKRIAVALAIVVLMVISVSLYFVNQAKVAAEEAREVAVTERLAADNARRVAEVAKEEAIEQKQAAEVAKEKEAAAKVEALAQKQAAELAREEAVEQRLAADKARVAAEEAKMLEEKAKVEALAQKQKAEEAKELEEKAKVEALAAKKKADAARIAAVEAKVLEEKAKVEAIAQKQKAEAAKLAAEEAKFQEEKAKLAAIEQRKVAVAAEKRASYAAYVARIGAAAAKVEDNAFEAARALLVECDDRFRDWEWKRLSYLCGRSLQEFETDTRIDCLDWSPDGNWFVTGAEDGKATVWDVATNERLREIDCGGPVHGVDLSSAGERSLLAVGCGGDGPFVAVFDVKTGDRIRVFGSAQDRHTRPVNSVQFSANGQWLVTGSEDGTARVWDVATGRQRVLLRGHTRGVNDLSIGSANGGRVQDRIATVGDDGVAVVWIDRTGDWTDPDSIERRPKFRGHNGRIYCVAFSPDGRRVATGGEDKRVLLWNADELEEFDFAKAQQQFADAIARGEPPESNVSPPKFVAFDSHSAAVRSVAFSANGRMLVSGSHDNTVTVWDTQKERKWKTLRGHGQWVRSSAVSPEGNRVLSASFDGRARLWDVESYAELVLRRHEDAVLDARFARNDSSRIVTAGVDGTISLWNQTSATPEHRIEFEEGHEFLASRAVFLGDGRMATAAVDDTVRIWNVKTGTQKNVLRGTGREAAVCASDDGKWILTGGPRQESADGATGASAKGVWQASLWDAHTGERLFRFAKHRAPVSAVAISPQRRFLYTGDTSGMGLIWDAKTGGLLHSLKWHANKMIAAAFVSDTRLLTAARERGVAVWNAETGAVEESKLLVHERPVVAMALADQQLLTATANGRLYVWDLETAKVVHAMTSPGGAEIDFVAASRDGRFGLSVHGDRQAVRMWNLAGGDEVRFDGEQPCLQLPADSQIRAAVFGRDGERVLTVGGDTARLWSLDTTRPQSDRQGLRFNPHGIVASAEISPDGTRVVSGSWDGSARIWNIKTGQAIQKLEGRHTRAVNCAAWAKLGTREVVVTVSDDHTASVWDVATGQPLGEPIAGHGDAVLWVAVSADNRRMVTASADGTARVWEIGGQGDDVKFTAVSILAGHDGPVIRAAFDASAQRVITGSVDTTAIVWQIGNDGPAAGKALLQLEGHTATVTSVAFAPDGQRAITGSDDYTARVWDIDPQWAQPRPGDTSLATEILALRGHLGEITAAMFSHDGAHALTASRDGTAIVWLTHEATAAEKVANR